MTILLSVLVETDWPAGWTDLALYDTSWREWGADSHRPVESDR